MRRWLFALFLCLPVIAAPAISVSEYKARRDRLRKELDGTLVLFGGKEGPDDLYGFFQEPDFNYLTGWREPDAVLILTPQDEYLFLPHQNKRSETFMGKHASAADAGVKERTGFANVLPVEKFETTFARALESWEPVYALPNDPQGAKLKSNYAFRNFFSPDAMLSKLRVVKSPAEIAAIQHATDISIAAHRAAWKRMQPGLYEYQLGATIMDTYLENGCERPAYASIVGSGKNGTVLHYSANRRRMDNGEVVVMDAAAECDGYTSDITRTVPTDGKFTARQREIYNVVLGAQKACIAAVKPGVKMSELTQIAKDYMNAHGKDLHGEGLAKYFVHGLGHPVGLQVHDPMPQTPQQGGFPLAANMVITIEPGIYIPEESIGVRIEDTILVTESGAKNLSGALPREIEEIEKALAR